ncbi:ROK family protein [Streptosporangium sp. NBC_01755]|uniref:polyphosphate--glucose phosphotransferase n=1 Tax=unclassified Streptosporangium TaxID=2632669 RepID=UPI002DD951CD|nr:MULTISPECIES: ROK family protein [unclassified Streptosporangium]WSA27249.1 ROK family protein [Streptosporangium sp. NBC_01810]WSD01198.1 ROK family protein [Streptosporangium sp. NBC_01755]
MEALGIDIGGSGIKGAPVDVATGRLTRERLRIPTPKPAKPRAVAEVVVRIVRHFGWNGQVGVTFPGVVVDGVVGSAANVDKEWIGTNARELFSAETGLSVTVLNDADAAGLAEVAVGAARDRSGVVMLLTFGTGIGSALLMDGRLVPNTELGHLELKGKEAEKRASDHAREAHGLGWDEWADRVAEYLEHLEALFSPSLFVIGGGVSKKADRFLPRIKIRTPIVPAGLQNEAGIVGAAMATLQKPRNRTA